MIMIRSTLQHAFAVSVLVPALGLWGCAAPGPTLEGYTPPPPGARWEQERRDSGSWGKGVARVQTTRGQRDWQGEAVVTLQTPEGTTLMHPDGGWLAMLRGEQPVVSWSPPLRWDFPLQVGKQWLRHYLATWHAAGRKVDYEVRQTVQAYEDVTVPAGTFKVWRIASVDTQGNDDVYWFDAERGIFVKLLLRRTASHAQGPGQREVELLRYQAQP